MSGSHSDAAGEATAPGPGSPSTGGRGHTVIAERVVEKIAVLAVQDADRAGGAAPRMLGVPLGRDLMQRPARVTAWVDGPDTALTVTVSLSWPTSARTTTRRLRAHIIDRVQELTGLHVDHVDIDVVRLPPPQKAERVR